MRRSGIALILLAVAAPASATPATAGGAPKFGAPIPGLCLLARAEAMDGSRTGKEIKQRIDHAQGLVTRQVVADKERLERELAAAGPKDAVLRMQIIQKLNAISQFENDARARIADRSSAAQAAIEPRFVAALSAVVSRRSCSLIVERTITYGWNHGMDITGEVISAMDAAN